MLELSKLFSYEYCKKFCSKVISLSTVFIKKGLYNRNITVFSPYYCLYYSQNTTKLWLYNSLLWKRSIDQLLCCKYFTAKCHHFTEDSGFNAEVYLFGLLDTLTTNAKQNSCTWYLNNCVNIFTMTISHIRSRCQFWLLNNIMKQNIF